ncbi:MAG: ECF transporter S component [Clostridiales bacterium]|nr:ECF transporter S component [Clostridiales bacterium]
MLKQIIENGKKRIEKWSTSDLLVTAILSIVFAIILLGVTYVYMMIIVPLGPLAMFSLHGIWFIPPILVAYVMRRPGAALLSQIIISLTTVAFSPWGWMELTIIITRGLPIELGFLATRYQNYRVSALMLISIATGLVAVAIFWVPLGINILAHGMQMATVIAAIVNAGIAGWATKMLADSIAKTGVLSNYEVGKEMQEEV